MTEQRPSKDLNWMPFDAGVKFLADHLMVNEATWVLRHWNCKYVDVRVDMRTGSMLIRPGNERAAAEPKVCRCSRPKLYVDSTVCENCANPVRAAQPPRDQS
jgi:hypothetical protein